MNDLQIFENHDFGKVRTVIISGEPYFVGKDVAEVLGYVETAKAIRTHCKGVSKMDIPSNGGMQEMSVIPESDVYRLIFRSKLPAAEKFEEWVTSEVLPAIRKTGSYSSTMSQAEMLLHSAQLMVEHERKLLALESEQSQQSKQIEIINSRLDMFNGIEETTSREALRHKLNAYCFKNGIAQSKAWNVLKQAFNDAYNTNVCLLMTLYCKNNNVKKITFPEYLEKSDKLVDAHAVLDKMLNR